MDLAITAWALATLALEDSELLQALRPAAVLHIWEFNPQDLTPPGPWRRWLWRTPSFWRRVCRRRSCKSGSSNLRSWRTPRGPWRRWRWRTLRCWRRCGLRVVLHGWEFNPQGLANTAWAMATLALEDPELLEAMRPAAAWQFGDFKP